MILRKPYAFFIKHFKLIHLILSALMIYSLYRTKIILDFFNSYASSLMNVVGQDLLTSFMYGIIYIVPILVIMVTVIILIVMIVKKKPFTFYLINILLAVYMIVILFVTRGTLSEMELKIIDPRTIRLVRDLMSVSFITQIISLIIVLIRAVGFNIKKFDFKKDLQELEIEETDREEFEVELSLDKNKLIRNIRKQIRVIKYTYKENKLTVIVVGIFSAIAIGVLIYIGVNSKPVILNQNTIFSGNGYMLSVENAYLTNTDYKGNIINDDNYYLALNIKIRKTKTDNDKLDIATTKIVIDRFIYTPTLQVKDLLFDFGNIYQDEIISNEYETKTLLYEIPKQLINQDILFSYVIKNKLLNKENDIKVKINYEDLTKNRDTELYEIKENLHLKNILDYHFTIKSFDIKKQYKLQYDFCINKECFKSYEYIKPTATDNFNKAILKLEGTLTKSNISLINIYDLYDFIEYFGEIKYVVNGQTYMQKAYFKEIISKNVKEKDVYYIEVNENVLKASNISIILSYRNQKYEYILK